MIFALSNVRTCKVTKNIQEASVLHIISEATNILYEILRTYTYLIQQWDTKTKNGFLNIMKSQGLDPKAQQFVVPL